MNEPAVKLEASENVAKATLTSYRLRVRVRKHGHLRFEAVQGGEKFADLFPDLCGQVVAIGGRGLELVGDARLMAAVGWLSANGYFLRGGLQS